MGEDTIRFCLQFQQLDFLARQYGYAYNSRSQTRQGNYVSYWRISPNNIHADIDEGSPGSHLVKLLILGLLSLRFQSGHDSAYDY